jgi:hypothetical protein
MYYGAVQATRAQATEVLSRPVADGANIERLLFEWSESVSRLKKRKHRSITASALDNL